MGIEVAIFSGIIGAIVGGSVSLISTNVQKMNTLDSKSEWRKKLLELASKDMMTLDDVYLLRATLRFDKHKPPYELYSFKYFSNEITIFCDDLVYLYSNKRVMGEPVYIVNDIEREIIRIYARYLLKNHWEVFSSSFFLYNKEFKIKKENEIGRETSELIRRLKERGN
ncbi:hypothetical protein RG601_04835 [Enterococcus sp. FR169]|uniref:hypothetical protein n=1 Tax=Enterococcus sp. FR169 TaxID=2923505 RepID=UPI00280F9AE8|nr:hypothetical protein [Enterococcus sp. FR169]MDQ8644361.1 hypothetical protein [Enterococcus sp. FR169]